MTDGFLAMPKLLFPLLLLIILFSACQTPGDEAKRTATPRQPAPLRPLNANKMGIHLLLDDGRKSWHPRDWRAHMEAAREVVGEWGYVTQVIRGDKLNPRHWQRFLDLCAELHLTPILRLGTRFDHDFGWWQAPLRNPDGSYTSIARRYAQFIAQLDWPTPDHYIIIGNEPNNGHEWGGKPDPAAYARFLLDVAAAIRALDPDARIMNAPLDLFIPHTGSVPFENGVYTMDAESFMAGMVAAEPDVFFTLDLWASHAYPLGAFIAPPWEQEYGFHRLNDARAPHSPPPPAGIYNRGINGYHWELWKLASYDVRGLPVMITETGWRKRESTEPAATDINGDLPDAETAAVYFDLAFYGNPGRYPNFPTSGWTAWNEDPVVVAVTPFAFNGDPLQWGHSNWLKLDLQGNILGVYAMAEVIKTRHPD